MAGLMDSGHHLLRDLRMLGQTHEGGRLEETM